MKKIKFAIRRDAIRESGINIFPAIRFELIIKLRIAMSIPNITCLFLSGGDVMGSGSMTIAKNRIVGLRIVVKNIFGEKILAVNRVKMTLATIKLTIEKYLLMRYAEI